MDTSCTTSAIATAGEDEDPWTILTSFSLRKYIVSSVEFYMNDKEAFKNELLSGVTVAVMQVPESVAFSFVAGVPPLVGLREAASVEEKGSRARVGAARPRPQVLDVLPGPHHGAHRRQARHDLRRRGRHGGRHQGPHGASAASRRAAERARRRRTRARCRATRTATGSSTSS